MNRISLILLFCLSLFQISFSQSSKKIKYNSNRPFALNMDGYRILDTGFSLEISDNPSHVADIAGGENGFIHILEFKNKQKIVTIYNPRIVSQSEFSELNLNVKEWKKLCEANNLLTDISHRMKFLKRRTFGIRKIADVNFFIMYINVKRKNVRIYNHSIKSVKLSP